MATLSQRHRHHTLRHRLHRRPEVVGWCILTAAGNVSLRNAVGEGFQMAWWSKATERPRTVGRLHEYYSHGASVLAAGLSLRRPSFIALATLLASILAIDGPLLQRASSTHLVERQVASAPVRITVGTQMPFGYTGKEFSGDSSALSTRPLLNPGFADVFRDYSQRVPISAAGVAPDQCHGVCEGEIEAMGIWKTCNSSEEIIVSPGMNMTGVFTNRTLFLVDMFHHTKYPAFFMSEHGQTKIAEDNPSNSRDPPDEVSYSTSPTHPCPLVEFAASATTSAAFILHGAGIQFASPTTPRQEKGCVFHPSKPAAF